MGKYTRVNRVRLSESRELVVTDYIEISKICQRRYVLRDKDTDINLTDVVISSTVVNAIRYLCLYECTPPTMTKTQFRSAKHALRGYYWALALWQQLGEDTDDIRLHIRVRLSESRELVITDYIDSDIGKICQRRYVLRDKDTDINLTDVVISCTVVNAIRYLCLYECTPPTMTKMQFRRAKHALRDYYWALALWQQLGEDTDDIRLHIDCI